MDKGNLIACLVWIGLAGFAAILSVVRYKLGRMVDPGPGFLPFLSSLILGILAVIYWISQVWGKREKPGQEEGFRLGLQWKKVAYLMGGSLVYMVVLWNNLGYLISTAILLFFLLKTLAEQSIIKSLIISVVTTIISYLIFERWLQVSLPKGIFKNFNF